MEFTDLLDKYGIEYATEGKHCRPGWVQLDCPFCPEGTAPMYLGYNIQRGFCNCWRCGPHSALNTLIQLTKEPARDLRRQLDGVESIAREEQAVRGKLKIPQGVGPLHAAHLRYLRERGFDPAEIARLWQVQGIAIAGRLTWRLFIPILYRGKTVSWTTRSIAQDHPLRYISASLEEESMPKKSLLYGEDYCRHAIIVHEGPIDVWRTGPGAVATMGTGVSSEQVLRISRYPKRIICFDNEPAAQERARELCDLLEVFDGETINVQLDAKDAASSSDKEIKQLRKFLED